MTMSMFYQVGSPTANDDKRLFNDLSQLMGSPTPKSKPQKHFTDMKEMQTPVPEEAEI